MKTALKSAVVFPQMVELRRTFPRYPELAFEEKGHWFRLMGYIARNACHKRITAILTPITENLSLRALNRFSPCKEPVPGIQLWQI